MRVRFLLLFCLAVGLGGLWAVPRIDEPVESPDEGVSLTVDLWGNGHVIGTPDGDD